MRKYIISIIIISLLFGCKKDNNNSLDEQVMIDLNINLNLFLDFSLELDNSSSNSSRSSFKTDSDFVNVFDDELTIKFTSEPAGFQNSLTFNPSDSNASVRLPYGNYNWKIESSIVSGTAISQKLPVYGQSSSTILINEPNVNLDLVVQTDYSLVTVNSEHVSSVILKHDDDSLNLESKDGFFYGYVFSGATSFTLEVTDKEGSKITTTLDSVESCKEYKYTLNYSNVNVSSLVCLCDPFEVIERFLVPSPTSVSDHEGNLYGIVELCGKLWTTSNAKLTTYKNGDPIFDEVYQNIKCERPSKFECNDEYKNQYIETFGRLYTRADVVDNRGIAPDGWRVPTREDFQCLIDSFENPTLASIALKSSNLTDLYCCCNAAGCGYDGFDEDHSIRLQQILTEGRWYHPGTVVSAAVERYPTNSSGFSALPGGDGTSPGGGGGALTYNTIGENAMFISSSYDRNENEPIFMQIPNFHSGVQDTRILSGGATSLGSLRFVKDID